MRDIPGLSAGGIVEMVMRGVESGLRSMSMALECCRRLVAFAALSRVPAKVGSMAGCDGRDAREDSL
jgi:hypothetical protein